MHVRTQQVKMCEWVVNIEGERFEVACRGVWEVWMEQEDRGRDKKGLHLFGEWGGKSL